MGYGKYGREGVGRIGKLYDRILKDFLGMRGESSSMLQSWMHPTPQHFFGPSLDVKIKYSPNFSSIITNIHIYESNIFKIFNTTEFNMRLDEFI